VELRQLATFVAVAEEGSFTRASDRLHVVQSAVSAGIRSLERELGVSLFDRTTHRVELTDAGEALLPEARSTLAAAAAAREAVDQVRGGLRGTVVLGTMQAQAMRAINVPDVLASFRAEHPGVEIKIRHSGGSMAMAEDVREGRLDMAFVALPRWTGLRLIPITREVIQLGVPAGHPLARRRTVSLEAVSRLTLVDLPEGWGTRTSIDRSFVAAGVRRTVTYEVNDTSSMIEFIRTGLAVGMLPSSFAEETEDIVFIPITAHAPQFETALALPAERRISAASRALLDTINQRVLALRLSSDRDD
jgi:DNA-binding transcriptional LysR family regulator